MASAEAAEKVAGGGEAAPSGGSKKLILIAAPLLLVIAAGGAWFAGVLPFGGSSGAKGEKASAEHGAEAGHEGAADAQEGGHGGDAHGAPGAQSGAIRPLDPFLANLADDGVNRYLKATIQVEFASEPPPSFEARMPQIRDAVLTLLTSRTFAEIRTPSGKEDLRDDVIDRLNHVLQTPVVKAVYFTEFIVQ